MQENFKTVVQEDNNIGLYIVIERGESFYGNLNNVWLEIAGEKFKVSPYDLTTKFIVSLPSQIIQQLNIEAGHKISGTISFGEHKELAVPNDVKAAFEGANTDINMLPLPQRRQGLLFIAESKNDEIRRQRIAALVAATSGMKK